MEISGMKWFKQNGETEEINDKNIEANYWEVFLEWENVPRKSQ